MPKQTFVWRIHVVSYPEGVDWRNPPKAWIEHWSRFANNPDEMPHFQWPARLNFFSKATAEKRAGILRDYGCTVEVLRSQPVVWLAAGSPPPERSAADGQ